MGKILEKVVADRLIFVLEERGLLTGNQAGFRPGKSTVDQVLKLVQDDSDNMMHNPEEQEPWPPFSIKARLTIKRGEMGSCSRCCRWNSIPFCQINETFLEQKMDNCIHQQCKK